MKTARFIAIAVGVAALHQVVTEQAEAAPIVSFGSGSAVTTIDRTANFDSLIDFQNLFLYTEGMLGISAGDNAFFGFNPFGAVTAPTNFHYGRDGNNQFVTITTTDGSEFSAVEFLLGHGFQAEPDASVVWETSLNGTSTGSGSFQTVVGTIVGWSDTVSNFDTLKVAAGGLSYTAFGQLQGIALDDLNAQLSPGVTPVPLPAALPLFAGGLGLLGLFGWRRKRSTAAAA